jgi:hypothetical protein
LSVAVSRRFKDNELFIQVAAENETPFRTETKNCKSEEYGGFLHSGVTGPSSFEVTSFHTVSFTAVYKGGYLGT